MKTITLKKLELPPEKASTKHRRWTSLTEAVGSWASSDRPFEACQRRGLEVVVNTVDDGRVVAAIDGCIGVARSLLTALRRAAVAWDTTNKPRQKNVAKKKEKR